MNAIVRSLDFFCHQGRATDFSRAREWPDNRSGSKIDLELEMLKLGKSVYSLLQESRYEV